ncbi:MAG: hypothetical protein KC897_04420 [Candidatus Omnitrophica bacterium]|nr:hypothetical protein [Candidatus Omnitrophota bacterium]MCB9720484.1 hypothetical protein [Candidatus Omnitrophota bacterium]
MPKTRLAGVKILCILVLLSSFLHIHSLLEDTPWYFENYAYLPAWLAVIRYSFSWFQRILGVTAAVLTLMYRELGRKLLLIIGIFTITTVYWKHPFEAVKIHAEGLQASFPEQAQQFSLDSIAATATVFLILIDVTFQGIVIYYFTRKRVKEAFANS